MCLRFLWQRLSDIVRSQNNWFCRVLWVTFNSIDDVASCNLLFMVIVLIPFVGQLFFFNNTFVFEMLENSILGLKLNLGSHIFY